MSIFDPATIARNKAIVDAMPAWKRGEPMNRRRVSDVDKLRAVNAQLLEAQKDAERLDWLNDQAESGVITIGFELDGGVFLDHASIANMKEYSVREKNTIRDAIDAARQKEESK